MEDNITREAAVKSAQIIVDRQIIINCQIIIIIIIINCQRSMILIQPKLIAELKIGRHGISMDIPS